MRRGVNLKNAPQNGVIEEDYNGTKVAFGAPVTSSTAPLLAEYATPTETRYVEARSYANSSNDAELASTSKVAISTEAFGGAVKNSVQGKLLVRNFSRPNDANGNPLLWWYNVAGFFLGIALFGLLLGLALGAADLNVPLYSAFRRYNPHLKLFDVSLTLAHYMRLDLVVAFLPLVYSAMCALSFFGFTRAYAEEFIAESIDPIGGLFTGVIIGAIIAITGYLCGSTDPFAFFGSTIIYVLYRGFVHCSEYMNKPSAGVGEKGAPVNWVPAIFGAGAVFSILAWFVLFFIQQADDKASEVPAYAYIAMLFVSLALIIELIFHAASLTFSIFDKYTWTLWFSRIYLVVVLTGFCLLVGIAWAV
jgi:hypothetical protein